MLDWCIFCLREGGGGAGCERGRFGRGLREGRREGV